MSDYKQQFTKGIIKRLAAARKDQSFVVEFSELWKNALDEAGVKADFEDLHYPGEHPRSIDGYEAGQAFFGILAALSKDRVLGISAEGELLALQDE